MLFKPTCFSGLSECLSHIKWIWSWTINNSRMLPLLCGVISQVNCVLSWKPYIYFAWKYMLGIMRGWGSSILFVCLGLFDFFFPINCDLQELHVKEHSWDDAFFFFEALVCRHVKYQTEMQEEWVEQKIFRLFPSVPWQKQMGGWGNLPIWTRSQPPLCSGLQKAIAVMTTGFWFSHFKERMCIECL